jgi:hypothetical protein
MPERNYWKQHQQLLKILLKKPSFWKYSYQYCTKHISGLDVVLHCPTKLFLVW